MTTAAPAAPSSVEAAPLTRTLRHRDTDPLRGASRIWSGAPAPGLQARLFRRRIVSRGEPAAVDVRISASSYYHLWVNGCYVGRGPTFHSQGVLPVDEHELRDVWKTGENVVAVLVYCPGFPTHQVPSGEPGLWAAVCVRDAAQREDWTVTDDAWRVSDRVGWRRHAVRHGYALGPVEVLDAAAHEWGWQEPGHDDSAWSHAKVLPWSGSAEVVDVPPLRFGWAAARRLVGVHGVGRKPSPLERGQSCEPLGEWLQAEPWADEAAQGVTVIFDPRKNALDVEGLTPEEGTAVVVDMGREEVGNLIFDCDSESAGTLEIGWSEVLRHGKPEVTHKGTTYVDRLLARQGTQRWEALQFTGLRYIVLILRGFRGAVRFTGIGVRTSTSVPQLHSNFESDDARLDAVWKLCARTLRIGTQETIIDCPSREQAPYLGDGHLVGRWLGEFGGNHRHWRYLIRLGFESQAKDGLMRDAPLMPVQRALIDYVLLTVVGLRDYVRITGDIAFGREHLRGCRDAMGYFDRRRDASCLLKPSEIEGISLSVAWDIAGPPRLTEALDPHVFIDHPGLGGHNVGEAGIERRGRSGAMHALYVIASEALADLEESLGSGQQALHRRQTAAHVRAAASAAYWDAAHGHFADAIDGRGGLYPQVSEQTHVLAILAGFTCPVKPADLLRRILRPSPRVARCGSYFYAYLLPLMGRLDMHAEALDLVRSKWGHMLDHGATSLWETFNGDKMDTWCHPWSAAPASFLMRHVLGIQTAALHDKRVVLRPRFDLLRHARGHVPWPGGKIGLRWDTQGQTVVLRGLLPDGITGELHSPGMDPPTVVTSRWRLELPAARPLVAV